MKSGHPAKTVRFFLGFYGIQKVNGWVKLVLPPAPAAKETL